MVSPYPFPFGPVIEVIAQSEASIGVKVSSCARYLGTEQPDPVPAGTARSTDGHGTTPGGDARGRSVWWVRARGYVT